MTFRERARDSVGLLRQWGLAGGRDMVATTRDSFVSVEGRAGVAVFVGLWALGRWQAGPWAVWGPELGGEIVPDVHMGYAGEAVGAQVLLLGIHIFLGAAWGVAAKNAGGFMARVWPRFSVYRLKPWIGGVLSGVAILAGHGILLIRDVARHPALFQETFLDRGGWMAAIQRAALLPETAPWTAVGTVAVAFWMVLAAGEWGVRFFRWWMNFPRPTRLATMVLGGALVAFAAGVWGVGRIQAQRNAGPNLLLISVDGWRTSMSETTGDVSALKKKGQGPRVRSSTVAPSADLSPSLATALSGLSPGTHGIRHDFVSADDRLRGVETLPDLLKKGGWTTVLLADGPSGFIDRMAGRFEHRHVASSHAGVRMGRRLVERSPHILPYLSGRWGRRLGLRGSVLMADPALLADEVDHVLGGLKNRPKFFLWVHFSSPGSTCAVVSPRAAGRLGLANDPFFRRPGRGFDPSPLTVTDENVLRRFYAQSLRETHAAIRRIFEDLARRRMDTSTAVVAWSPRAALLSSDDLDRVRRLDGPAFEGLPFFVWEGALPMEIGGGRTEGPGRAMDVAPTAARLVGVDTPSVWEGVSMTEGLPSGEWGAISIESSDPTDPVAHGLGLPSPWEILVEDRAWPGRYCRNPAWEDPFLIFRNRSVRLGSERVLYRPGLQRVDWSFDSVSVPTTGTPWVLARAHKERIKELKDIFFRTLARDSGWRPQNDYWIPESFLREMPLPLEPGEDERTRRRMPRFWTDSK
ncbi:MAG: sulfatase-like hydrolase/transferase [Elusimicrobia bacterium]|nr:sulfatase-like hydrolase/transferase [Elusimicrobiota bacterium]